mmetsp:Transcript_65600/g.182431  ORF Transcript_65600/g.182431 Transcript_65600/m.182431 type:complete len:456 (-) Transcript_65600:86-1453(-)
MGGGSKFGGKGNALGNRKRVSNTRFRGVVLEWKGSSGWVRPQTKIDHPAANANGGRIYVHKDDLRPGVALASDVRVDFIVYSDGRGLGGQDVRVVEALAEDVRKPDATLPNGWEKYWSAEHEEHYYWNRQTKEASWMHPSGEENLPAGWTKEYDADREEWYYWHKPTRTAQWERPEAAATPEEEAAAADNKPEEAAEDTAPTETPLLGQMRKQGIVTAWHGFFGWMSPLDDLGPDLRPLLERNEDKIYINWRDVQGGAKLKVGSHVDFTLYADGSGVCAADVRLFKEGQQAPEVSAADVAANELEERWAEQDAEAAERAAAKAPAHGLAELSAAPDDEGDLLPGWEQVWSDEHGCNYYWHKATQQSSWDRPSLPREDDEDTDGNLGGGKVWEGEGTEEGAAKRQTPLTPMNAKPGIKSAAPQQKAPMKPAQAQSKGWRPTSAPQHQPAWKRPRVN